MKSNTRLLALLIGILLVFSSYSQTVYVTNTGEKYHTSSCRYLSKSKNAIELKDAIAQGYEACKVCRPSTQVKTESKTESKQELKKEETSNQSTSSQCSAITKAGSRCKRTTTSSNGKCWQHGGN